MPIRQITIVGTGLIGGSLGLALKQADFAGEIVGCDKRAVLEMAQARNAIDRAEADLERAIVGSDVIVLGIADVGRAFVGSEGIVLSTRVASMVAQLETVGPKVPPNTLITDAGST